MTRRGFLAALVAVPAAVKAMATKGDSPWDSPKFARVPMVRRKAEPLGFKVLGTWAGAINGQNYMLTAYDMGDKCSLCRTDTRTGVNVELCPLERTDRVDFFECASGVVVVGGSQYPIVFIGDHIRAITAMDKETALLNLDPYVKSVTDEYGHAWCQANVGSREFRVRELGVPSAEGVPGRRDYVTARKARARLWDAIVKSGALSA